MKLPGIRALFALGIVSSLFGCSTTSNNQKPLRLKFVSSDPCAFEFEGKRYESASAEEFAMMLRKRPTPSAVVVEGDTEIPYRCVGGVIFALQSAGLTKIGLLASPTE